MANEPRTPVISKSVGNPYYISDDWQDTNNVPILSVSALIPLVLGSTEHSVWNNFTNVPYFVLDSWLVPPVILVLTNLKPIGGHTLYEETKVSRAYDWLVTQYSMLTPATPPGPAPFGSGKLTPNYFYNQPSTYALIKTQY